MLSSNTYWRTLRDSLWSAAINLPANYMFRFVAPRYIQKARPLLDVCFIKFTSGDVPPMSTLVKHYTNR